MHKMERMREKKRKEGLEKFMQSSCNRHTLLSSSYKMVCTAHQSIYLYILLRSIKKIEIRHFEKHHLLQDFSSEASAQSGLSSHIHVSGTHSPDLLRQVNSSELQTRFSTNQQKIHPQNIMLPSKILRQLNTHCTHFCNGYLRRMSRRLFQ